MPTELSFGAALLVGLLSSAHCIGMCSGIVGALNMGISASFEKKPNTFVYQLAYNFGRIGSYVLVGTLAGLLGAGVSRLNITPGPLTGDLIAAAFMIALGLYLTNWWRGLAILEKIGYGLWKHIQPLGQRLLPVHHPLQALLLGMVWGWLPCGLVYAVVAWSLSTAEAFDGAILMLGFGLGTLPSMLLAGTSLSHHRRWLEKPMIRTLAGIMIIGFGVYNGLNSLDPHAHQQQAKSGQNQAILFAWAPATASRLSTLRISTSRRLTLNRPQS
jgi:hypothetical protein